MASAIIHIAVAKKLNEQLKMNEKELFLGTIAPDISKHIGQDRKVSHFLYENRIPNLNLFLKKYNNSLNIPFIMGYYIHLFTDYLWFKYFFNEITNLNTSITLLNGDTLKCSKEIVTKNVSERIEKLISESDISLFLPGGLGTINELFMFLESKRSHEFDKPIIIYNCCGFFDELLLFLEKIYNESFTMDYIKDSYFISNDIDEILNYISKN